MQAEDIKIMIEGGLPDSVARVAGDGSHFEAVVICDAFSGKRMLEQHQMVYGTLGNSMESAIHALSIKTYTQDEWAQRQGQSLDSISVK